MFTPLITDASKKYGNNRWQAYSHKLNRTVFLFSDLEYEYWLQLEFDSNVLSFCEQPLKVTSFLNNKEMASIFDMWVLYKDGYEEFVEIKYSSDLQKEKVQKQIAIQREWCKKNQKNHRVVTENEIKQHPIQLSNMKFMIKMIGNPIENKELIELIKLAIINSNEKINLEELSVQVQTSLNKTLKIISFLICTHEIKSDFHTKPFGKKTEVWI